MKIMGAKLMKYADLMIHVASILISTHLRETKMINAELTPRRRKKKRINMIMGSLQICNDYVRSTKEYERKAVIVQKWPRATNEDALIIFEEADTDGLDKPHSNPLVIKLMISDCEVTHILVDTGSSVDIIFKDTLEKMEIKDTDIKSVVRPPTRVTSETPWQLEL